MKRLLIIGATGALGRAVIERTKRVGSYQIFATSSGINPDDDKHIAATRCDVRDLKQVTDVLDWAKPDIILLISATFTNNLSEAYTVNVAPAAHILDLVHKLQLKTRVVLIGSAAEYGPVTPQENPISETCALRPVSVYGVSKAWQSQIINLYSDLGVDVLCARIFNLFGPGVSTNLFAGRLQQQISAVKLGQQSEIKLGSLSAIRDYVSTDEAARQLLLIANQGTQGNIYHIGSGKPVIMRDFLHAQLTLHDLPLSIVHESADNTNRRGYDVPMIYANMLKTRNLERNTVGILNV